MFYRYHIVCVILFYFIYILSNCLRQTRHRARIEGSRDRWMIHSFTHSVSQSFIHSGRNPRFLSENETFGRPWGIVWAPWGIILASLGPTLAVMAALMGPRGTKAKKRRKMLVRGPSLGLPEGTKIGQKPRKNGGGFSSRF